MSNVLPIPRPRSWPPGSIKNELGIATVSIGNWRSHKLFPRLDAAAAAGFKAIDLFDECWAAYLDEIGLDGTQPWEPTAENLEAAERLSRKVKDLGMRISCTQPLRKIEGVKDAKERRETLNLVAKRFPFMRAFDTDLVFMCASIRQDEGVTADLKTVAKDLAEMGDMAAEFSRQDGGKMLKIGYEGLSWASRNTWSASWEAVRMANRDNVGMIVDAFNVLAVEWADPYNADLHGRVFSDIKTALKYLCLSLASMVASVPAEKIFLFQIGDAELVDPRRFPKPTDPETPDLLPWSRGHRLFPLETSRGAYMPTELVAAAVLATGYEGPLSLEVFSNSLFEAGTNVPVDHCGRAIRSLENLIRLIPSIPAFWDAHRQTKIEEIVRLYHRHRQSKASL